MTSPTSEPTPNKHLTIAAGLRVAVIGARRTNMGTGGFLAQQAHAAGAEIVAVVGSTYDTARLASEELLEFGMRPEVFAEEEEMLLELAPDVVIIASPTSTHIDWLQQCLQQEVHVFCEKPLCASGAQHCDDLIRQFTASGLLLSENCQWPFTLSAWHELHGQDDFESAKKFSMLLSPKLRGERRWQDILSHPISLIQRISPGPAHLEKIEYTEVSREADDSSLRFEYCTHLRVLECEIILEDLSEFPPPAEYSIDGKLCHRIVDSNYQMKFSAHAGEEANAVSIADPVEQSLHTFLQRVNLIKDSRAVALDEDLIRRQYLVEALLAEYQRH
ncbi:MAG: Gfo/Idh/MocA family oxidoreductase [Planctomycetes bacterium]|nr:Gfo/Idh/MocA family oxidoreductase [Planctomycetota bacterium]